jgi:transposase
MEMRVGRRFRSTQERREIVEETYKTGESVSRVARSHGINANQVFHWRKQYREGWFDEGRGKSAALVPVRISGPDGKSVVSTHQSSKATRSRATGLIEIVSGSTRIRIEGAADPECVRAVMDGLGR